MNQAFLPREQVVREMANKLPPVLPGVFKRPG
jgi:hypothetical protein